MKQTIALLCALGLVLAIVGCGDQDGVMDPADSQRNPDLFDPAKAGGGGSPQLDCNDLVAPGGLQEYIDMAKARCNPQNSYVLWSSHHIIPDPEFSADDSYSMQWYTTDSVTRKNYVLSDICTFGSPQEHEYGGEVVVEATSVQFNYNMVDVALLPQNRATMIVDAYGNPGDINCYTWPDGSFMVQFYYLGKEDTRRFFYFKHWLTPDVDFEDPGSGE